METAELLKPRYKVIADYPGSVFNIGRILPDPLESYSQDEENDLVLSMNKYPHLFRKLEWWEDRAVEDMPEYVKDSRAKVAKAKYEISTFNGLNCYDTMYDTFPYKWTHILPSTEQEYNDYLATTKTPPPNN